MSEESKKLEVETDSNQATLESTQQEAASMVTEIANLRQQVASKEEEAKNNYDRFVRQVAELDNFKKRTTREREEAIRFANEALIKDLLPILDNLERAVAHAAGGGNGKPLVEGVEMVLKGFLDALGRHGVNQIVAVGQPFDPAQHEAMAQVESETHQPNTIVEEHHKGYMLRDRLLRPALVSVTKELKTQGKKNQERTVENDPSDD
jgi:molecular chaperone GrpE